MSERRQVKQLSKLSGKSVRDLESLSYYFKISLTEMYDYYLCFGRLPEPEAVTVIRHIGVYNLIRAVQSGQLENSETNGTNKTTSYPEA